MNTSSSSTPKPFWCQHKSKIAWITSLFLTAGTIVLIFTLHSPHFQASALIDIEPTTPFIAFSDGKVRDRSINYIETQLELLQSPVVIAPVLSRPEIASIDEFQQHQAPTLDGQLDPIAYLQKHLSIHQLGKSQLYQVSYSSRSAQNAADIANAVVATYLGLLSDEEYRNSQRVIDLLEKERLRRSLTLDRLRTRVLELAKAVTGKDPFAGILVDPHKSTELFRALHQSLMEVEVDRVVIKAEIESLRDAPRSKPGQSIDDKMLDLEVANHPEVHQQQAMLDEICEKMQQINQMVVDLDSHAGYERLQTDFEEVTKQLSELRLVLRETFSNQQATRQAEERTLTSASLERKLVHLDVKKKILTSQLEEHLNDRQSGNDKSVQLEFTRTELAREEKIFEMIAARKLALMTELRAPARVRLRQAATVPTKPVNPIPYKKLLLGCFIAFILLMALAFVYRLAKGEAK